MLFVCCLQYEGEKKKKKALCPRIFSTQCTYSPPTPTKPYTQACPTVTSSRYACVIVCMKEAYLETPN